MQLSDSEDESDASVEEHTNDRTKLPREEGGYEEPNAEFVAFAYTRSTTGPQYPMLGIGMVCNTDDDTGSGGSDSGEPQGRDAEGGRGGAVEIDDEEGSPAPRVKVVTLKPGLGPKAAPAKSSGAMVAR